MTEQEIFTTAYTALRDRGFTRAGVETYHESGSTFSCRYRGEGGTPCALGFFITDAEYQAEWEGAPTSEVIKAVPLLASLGNEDFLVALQSAHDDGATPARMQSHLTEFAIGNNLEIPS